MLGRQCKQKTEKINEEKTGYGVTGAATGMRTMEQKKRMVTQERDELCGDLKARH